MIQFYDVKRLARHYGLPIAPATMPPVGQGRIYYRDALQQVAGRVRPFRDRLRPFRLFPLRLGVPHPAEIVPGGRRWGRRSLWYKIRGR